MSAEQPERGTVAITGANGTIGYACVLDALSKSYRVRCVVRREDAFSPIKSGPSIQQYLHLDRLECAIVPDNAAENAYDEALVGVQYVIHIAGAWPMPYLHPDDEIYTPFIKSTRNVIEAAKKSGTVKRVVFTQAGAGLVDSEVGDTYGNSMEQILNEQVKVNEASLTYHPPLKSAHQAYCAAKSQCMKYLNDLQLSKTLPFSIAQVIPGTVIGPSEFVTTRSQALKHIDRQTKALLFDDMKPRYAFGFVHVRECAAIHVNALDEEKWRSDDLPAWYIAAATSERGIDGERIWARAVEMVERDFANEVKEGVFKVGRSKVPINMPYRVDSAETEKRLLSGVPMKGLKECVKEVAEWYVSLKDE
ncbi:hypothetical protein HBI52_166240 [Parastagonospora nodorum]|nr:hypothetical protein HBI71_184290 [Parastagonospora nodorum]KAH5502676.1 hypothetical protein HBI52_166240 [Parastagonospora nodorum]KAH5672783.1 hypothetical protein HBI21_160530 [Parastagonospora nodorum]KAH5715983.1 hypothetical protein HBI20_137860 [Parastagonospora nodorum]